ncbi:hypothetical protein FB45DRAFT_1033593 [Roridomyces roridus]|uniref:Uncharacterized protein n=1 Tax=Roridomyces roridus TaxID=1738132 RepID=A0AAD7BEK3_9AGAR|nr:hypothetical protein FB45DRAFT_1033593 [Roridomyces roridus]
MAKASDSSLYTLGVFEIGGVCSTMLFGITSVQAFNYCRHYPKDALLIKLTVLSVWLLELAHGMVVWHGIFTLTVTFYGETSHIAQPPRTIWLSLLFSSLIVTIVQIFFANRIRVFSRRWIVSIICWLLAIIDLGTSLAMLVILMERKHIDVLQVQYRWLTAVSLGLSSFVDVCIAVSLCVLLVRMRTGTHRKTKRLTDKLIKWSIVYDPRRSDMGVFLFNQSNPIFKLDARFVGSFYLIQFLGPYLLVRSLNSRKRPFQEDDNVESVIDFSSNQGPGSPRNVVIRITTTERDKDLVDEMQHDSKPSSERLDGNFGVVSIEP